MKSPILFIIFNRPNEARMVFEAIRKAKPPKLYISADGPRDGNINDVNLCALTRLIEKDIDWDCEVFTNYYDDNIGIDPGVISAIDWFFSKEDEGIILEDDCLPDHSFFEFCDSMLEKYRDDKRVFVISGNNFQEDIRETEASYSFSIYTHTWGWASWKRSWVNQDTNLDSWPQCKKSGMLDFLHKSRNIKLFWNDLFENIYLEKHIGSSWDYKFLFSCWKDNGLNIIPSKNLISNIGHGENSTNTKDVSHTYADRKTSSLTWPLKHPLIIQRNYLADEQDGLNEYFKRNFLDKVLFYIFRPLKLIRIISKILINNNSS